MADDIFAPTGAPTASALEGLVGDGKKFTDNEALAKGKIESDGFITKLQEENAAKDAEIKTLTDKGASTATVADLIKAVRESGEQPKPDGADQQLTAEELQVQVRSIVQGDKETEQRSVNRTLGNSLVLGKKGIDGNADAAKTYIAERATALGTSVEQLGELSETSPLAFAKLMEIEPNTLSKGAGSLPNVVNSQALPTSDKVMEVDGHKTKSHYDAIRREKGAKAWINDSHMQTAMANDMAALGEKFNQ